MGAPAPERTRADVDRHKLATAIDGMRDWHVTDPGDLHPRAYRRTSTLEATVERGPGGQGWRHTVRTADLTRTISERTHHTGMPFTAVMSADQLLR